jgi:hypothetical protein
VRWRPRLPPSLVRGRVEAAGWCLCTRPGRGGRATLLHSALQPWPRRGAPALNQPRRARGGGRSGAWRRSATSTRRRPEPGLPSRA